MTETLEDFAITLVGCGKMGSALAEGLVTTGTVEARQLTCVDAVAAKAEGLAESIGASAASMPQPLEDATEAERRMIVVAVKPDDVREVVEAGREHYRESDLLVSIAAGLPLSRLEEWSGGVPWLARAMPNTPALVGRGMTGVFAANESDAEAVEALFGGVGRVVQLEDEADFHALTAVSGSGPAYVFTAIEALADGAVSRGMDRQKAIELAVETVAGSAELAGESDAHTAQLKDAVASPGGTTIRGLVALEERGFRRALIEAVDAAAQRSEDMMSELLDDH